MTLPCTGSGPYCLTNSPVMTLGGHAPPAGEGPTQRVGHPGHPAASADRRAALVR